MGDPSRASNDQTEQTEQMHNHFFDKKINTTDREERKKN